MSKQKATIAERIRSELKKFTPAERKLLNTLLANYPMVGLTNITDFAAEADVSTPTVLRAIKRLGFSGFPGFQNALRHELEQTLSDPITKHERWATDAPDTHILNRFASSVAENLRNSLNQIDHHSFDQVVKLLSNRKKTVHIIGGRITHAFADYLHTHLQVIRERVEMLPASSGLWPHHLLNIKDDDVLVVFDVRRYEADLIKLVDLAMHRKMTVVLFTDQWLSPIASQAEHVFSVRIEVPSAWDSGVATLFLIEALIAAIENKLWPQATARMKELENIFDITGKFRR